MRKRCVFRSICPDLGNFKTRVGDRWMDSAAMGSSPIKLDNKRAPYAAGPLRQASRLCIRVTSVPALPTSQNPISGEPTRHLGVDRLKHVQVGSHTLMLICSFESVSSETLRGLTIKDRLGTPVYSPSRCFRTLSVDLQMPGRWHPRWISRLIPTFPTGLIEKTILLNGGPLLFSMRSTLVLFIIGRLRPSLGLLVCRSLMNRSGTFLRILPTGSCR